jgi:hypothetical protein
VKWATFPEMADVFAKWEKANAGVDPRGPTACGETPGAAQKGVGWRAAEGLHHVCREHA